MKKSCIIVIIMLSLLTISAPSSAKVTVKTKSLSLTVGSSATIKVKKAKKDKISFSVKDGSIASVSKTGKVKAKKRGVTTVTVKSKKVSKKIKVYVSPVPGLYENDKFIRSWKSLLTDKSVEMYSISPNEIKSFSPILTGTLVIPEKIERIGKDAFEKSALTEILYPRSLKHIDVHAFKNAAITSFMPVLTSSLTSIYDGAFLDCAALSDINTGKAPIIFPDVFKNTKLTSFSVNTEKVDLSAFAGSKIESFHLGKNVSSVSGHFINNENLVSITVDKDNPIYTDNDSDAVINVSRKSLIAGCKATVFDDIVSVGREAFKDSVTPDVITTSAASIEASAFENSSAREINLTSVVSIGDAAFKNCRQLQKLSLPDTLTSIGGESLMFLDSLNKLYIPKGVKGFAPFLNVWPKNTCFADDETTAQSNISESIWSKDIRYGVSREEYEKI